MRKMNYIERISTDHIDLAIIIRSDFKSEGIEFFTPNTFSQQIGYMNRPLGYKIDPHIHKPVLREVEYTNEVLFIKTGKLRVDFFCEEKNQSRNFEKQRRYFIPRTKKSFRTNGRKKFRLH